LVFITALRRKDFGSAGARVRSCVVFRLGLCSPPLESLALSPLPNSIVLVASGAFPSGRAARPLRGSPSAASRPENRHGTVPLEVGGGGARAVPCVRQNGGGAGVPRVHAGQRLSARR